MIKLEQAKQLLTNAVDWPFFVGLRNRFRLKYFVETGTGGGVTARDAAVVFDRVWSIEINQALSLQAAARVAGLKNVELCCGDSRQVLPRVLAKLDAPALFYLDAHWCGGERQADAECPVLKEMELVQANGSDEDVIVIDNAGLFLNPPDPPHRPDEWPDVNAVLQAIRPGAFFQLRVDQFVITPGALYRDWKKVYGGWEKA